MPAYDHSKLPYWAQQQMNYRAIIWRPQVFRPVTGGGIQADVYGEPWMTDVPFGKRPARTGNDPFLIGSIEKDIVITLDLAFFPADLHMDVDYWFQDVTVLFDGTFGEKYGIFYSVRGETSEWVPTAINTGGANRIPALAEDNPPPSATGYVTPPGREFQLA